LNGKHRPGSLRLSPGFLVVSLFGAVLLSCIMVRQAHSRPEIPDGPVAPLKRVSSVEMADLSSPAPAAPIRLGVDATESCRPNTAALDALSEALASENARSAASAAGGAESDWARRDVNWREWARIETTPAPIYWNDAGPVDGLNAYAVHSRAGVTVCMSNRKTNRASIRLRVRLPRAPYELERLTYIPATDADRVVTVSDAVPVRQSNRMPQRVRLDRLMGRDMVRPGVTALPVDLLPGETCLLRFTDTAYTSRIALNQVREQLRAMPRASVELARRLRVIFDGSGAFESAISASCKLNPDRRRTVIHRFLLVLSQAYSLHRNFQVNNAVRPQIGSEFRAALERLNGALSDTSATLMGLIPEIDVSPEGAADGQTVLPAAARAGRNEDGHAALVTVALSNQGAHSAELVKIGLDQTMLPAGVTCEPTEPALFGRLAPGQTVRATFVLRWTGNHSLPENRCSGDISYFSVGAPAHLRPRPW